MVGYEQTENNARVSLLCFYERTLHYAIKCSVPTDNELCYSVFSYVPLYGLQQSLLNIVRRYGMMPDKKAGFQ